MMIPNRPRSNAKEAALIPGTAFIGVVDSGQGRVFGVIKVYERAEGILGGSEGVLEGFFGDGFVCDGDAEKGVGAGNAVSDYL